MPKYRSREIIEAVQWHPGVRIAGVHEVMPGVAVIDSDARRPKDQLIRINFSRWITVNPGDYVVLVDGAANGVRKADDFAGDYENIGG